MAKLELKNNGPVYYLSPITFSAKLITDLQDYREYRYSFKSERPEFNFNITTGKRFVQINHTFNQDTREKVHGVFKLHVKVSYTNFFIPRTVAEATMNFSLSDRIPANLILVQNRTTLHVDPDPQGKTLVSSAINVNASCAVNDPGGYFASQRMDFIYYWKLNSDMGIYNTSLLHRFPSTPGRESDFLQVFVTAKYPNGTYAAGGALSQHIVAMNPMSYLNSTGDLYLLRGSITKLNFSCDASPPIYYCFDPEEVPSPANKTDFSCASQWHRLESCEFGAVHYFDKVGDHEFRVIVYNEVNNFLHVKPWKMMYKIHIYDVESKGLLQLFIVPISCIIIGFVVIVVGIAFYKHTKGDIRVEVADFDFGGTSSSLDLDDPIQAAMFDERTFWTHLRDELAESSILFRWLSRRPKFLTTLSLMDDEILDDEDVSNKTVDPTLPPATSSSNNNNSTSGYSSIDNADAK